MSMADQHLHVGKLIVARSVLVHGTSLAMLAKQTTCMPLTLVLLRTNHFIAACI